MWLDGIDLSAHREARIASVRVMVCFYGAPDQPDSAEGAPLDDLTAYLAQGRDWLLDNEQGRQPE